MAGRSLRRPGGLATAHARAPGAGPPGIRDDPVRRLAPGRRGPQPEGAARRYGPDLRLRPGTGCRGSRCGPIWTRCRWPSGPVRRTRRWCRTSRTPAATTRTPRSCSARRWRLASVPELPVGVRLIFQAAEELMPGGAIDAIAAGALTGVSRIFALHCDPRLAVGKVAVRPGPITSAADQLEVTLHSPGGHTSRPHLTGDLVYGLGTLITGLPGVLSRRIDPRNSTVMVWGAVNAGVAANAIPQIRHAGRNDPHRQPRHLGYTGIDCARSGFVAVGAAGYRVQRPVPPRCAARRQRGDLHAHHHPRDRGHRLRRAVRHPAIRRRRGLLLVSRGRSGCDGTAGVWSGRGPQFDLHQPTFDIDERSLAVGVRVLVNIVDQAAQF